MKSRIIRSALSTLMAAALAGSCVIVSTADGIEIKNANFESDDLAWSEGDEGSWFIDLNWDTTKGTASIKSYGDVSADTPSSGSSAGLNLWAESAGSMSASQTVYVPAGDYEIKVLAMGADGAVSVSLGDKTSNSVNLSGWNVWDEVTLFVSGSGSDEKLSVNFDAADGGWGYIDSVSVEVKGTSDGGDDTTPTDSTGGDSSTPTDSSKPDTSSSKPDTTTSSSTDSGSGDYSGPVPTTFQNGDFEQYSETTLAWWDVDWKDELKIWFAKDEAKSARADKNNNYLDVWAEKAAHFSMKQTLHLKPGTYGVKFNLDANEGVDTGMKLRVGDLVEYTFPKGEGWEKWTTCETSAFTVTVEGDYDVEFYGDLAADTWFALDNITLTDGSGSAADGNKSDNSGSGSSNSSGSGSSNSGSTTTKSSGSTGTAAAASTSTSSAADTATNVETGAADTAGMLMGIMSLAAMGIVVSRKKSGR